MASITPVRKLEQIAEEMEALVGVADVECAHSRADDLLLEALDWMKVYDVQESVARIRTAFRNLEKWYA